MTGRPLAMVTGGARRVGRAICLELARAGCDVLFTHRQSADDARTLIDELRALNAAAKTDQLDLNDCDAALRWGESVAAREPRVDVLVHNASVYAPTPFESLDAAEALRHYRVNALSPLLLSRAMAPALKRSALPGGGSVVAMCDMHAMGRPRAAFSAYSMSKAALIEMVRTLARDLAPRVRVNGVAPGVVAFPEEGYESDPDAQRRYIERVPLKRAGAPEDAATVVRWLALDATYVTGEIVRVDGGRWLA